MSEDKVDMQPKHWYWLIRRGIEHPVIYARTIRKALIDVWLEAPWRKP